MNNESKEELRRHLLGDQQVQKLIQIRAFQIYELRGGAQGSEADDWFAAENEIISILIEEKERQIRQAQASMNLATDQVGSTIQPAAPTPESHSQPGDLAPPISGGAEFQADTPAPKKAASRAKSKSASTGKRKNSKEESKEGSAKKTATGRKSSKQAGETTSKPGTKAKKTRSQEADLDASES